VVEMVGEVGRLVSPSLVEVVQEASRTFFTNSFLTINFLPSAAAAAALLGLALVYVFLVNPLGFWGAMMEEMSGYASGYSLAYGGDELAGPDYQDYQGRARGGEADLSPEQRSLYPSLLHSIDSHQAPSFDALAPLASLARDQATLSLLT